MESGTELNLALFFEGTGQGVQGHVTNVTRLYDACAETALQDRFIAAGPGTQFGSIIRGHLRGKGWKDIFEDGCEWMKTQLEKRPSDNYRPHIFLFGFSRGALIARHFAKWLETEGTQVRYMGLWDTVDATLGLDVDVKCPANVVFARHAIARDEMRRFYECVRLEANPSAPGQTVEELVFPGSHSDVGGLYEDNHVVADVSLSWIAEGAKKAGLLFRDDAGFSEEFDPKEIVLHETHEESTNLWGALGKVRRALKGVKQHAICIA